MRRDGRADQWGRLARPPATVSMGRASPRARNPPAAPAAQLAGALELVPQREEGHVIPSRAYAWLRDTEVVEEQLANVQEQERPLARHASPRRLVVVDARGDLDPRIRLERTLVPVAKHCRTSHHHEQSKARKQFA